MSDSERQLIVLSQELIDMIIDYLAGDLEALKRCSFVSRRWRPRCRYQLFKIIVFSDSLPGQSIGRWCAAFGIPNVLANLTRELLFHQEKRLWVRPATLAPHLGHLARFTNVTTLVFVGLVTSVFPSTSLSDCFGSFVASIQRLRLHGPITRPKPLVQLLLFFSTATYIEIQNPRWGIAEESGFSLQQPPQSTRFTGTLYLRGFGGKWPYFFTLLSAEKLGFQRTRLVGCELDTSVPTQSFLDAISQTTRILHLVASGRQRLISNLTLRAFSSIETLVFRTTRNGIRGPELADLLNSIPSRRLTILALDVGGRESRHTDHEAVLAEAFFEEMKTLDMPLRRLATRALEGSGKRFTLILFARNPAVLSRSFVEFQQVGNTWEGERVIGRGARDDYYWTFRPAKDRRDLGIDEAVLRFLSA